MAIFEDSGPPIHSDVELFSIGVQHHLLLRLNALFRLVFFQDEIDDGLGLVQSLIFITFSTTTAIIPTMALPVDEID